MLLEGVKLMLIGMTTVLLFLSFMILLIQFVSYLTREATAREVEGLKRERDLQAEKRRKTKPSGDTETDIAVIAAAVAAYESERFAQA
jgi:sodium pump decarboxylase gamma subunit